MSIHNLNISISKVKNHNTLLSMCELIIYPHNLYGVMALPFCIVS